MICASCSADLSGESERCGACGDSPWLQPAAGFPGQPAATPDGERYRLDARIGAGASGVTYRAVRSSDGLVVCIKELPVRRLGGSFKAADLFHREASTLRQLQHPQVPRYVDDFVAGHGKATSLILVQDFVDGENLAEEMAARRYREVEVVDILVEMLGILTYLHGFSPPVVHRDIKPSNVMRRRSDGRLVLVDFGSVKSAVVDEVVGGSTVAGTFGYMAPEQLHGKASPSSDLYGLAVLALVLLTRRDPADLQDAEHRLDWKRHVRLHRETMALLDRWLQADPARRPDDTAHEERRARATLDALRGNAGNGRSRSTTATRPAPAARAAPAISPASSVPAASAAPVPRFVPEPSSGRVMMQALGACLAFLCLVAVIGIAGNRADPSASSGASHDSESPLDLECDPKPCRPLPDGLAGLRLGSAESEVRARTGPLEPVAARQISISAMTRWTAGEQMPELAPYVDSASAEDLMAAENGSVIAVDEKRFAWNGAIGRRTRRCELALTPDPVASPAGNELHLALVECVLVSGEDLTGGDWDWETYTTLRDQLQRKHGFGDRDEEIDLRWLWKGDRVHLAIEERSEPERRILLSSFTPAYASRLAAARRAAVKRFMGLLRGPELERQRAADEAARRRDEVRRMLEEAP